MFEDQLPLKKTKKTWPESINLIFNNQNTKCLPTEKVIHIYMPYTFCI